MKNLFLTLSLLFSFFLVSAQNAEIELAAINDFYHRSLAVNKVDSIRYKEDSLAFRKRISENPVHAPKHSDFAGRYAVMRLLRRNKKKRLDSIIEVVRTKNKQIGVDSVFVVKVKRVETGGLCQWFLKYPKYAYCAVKVKDTLLPVHTITQQLDKNKVYYFEGAPIIYKKSPKRKKLPDPKIKALDIKPIDTFEYSYFATKKEDSLKFEKAKQQYGAETIGAQNFYAEYRFNEMNRIALQHKLDSIIHLVKQKNAEVPDDYLYVIGVSRHHEKRCARVSSIAITSYRYCDVVFKEKLIKLPLEYRGDSKDHVYYVEQDRGKKPKRKKKGVPGNKSQ